ncbi:uncharacterized protein JCM10292_003680 [Rhodotorula paludigena]|uniref:uncharacterized protein n=1 Tax=Rhodotorula paludigena TaxID=86838 RepID=UPI00317F557C
MASPGGPQIKHEIYHEDKVTTLDEAGENLRRSARNPWTVLKENRRALAVILAIQSNAIIVGIEFALPGNMLGIPAFLRQFGELSPTSGQYAVEAKVLTIWAALFATFQVLGLLAGGFFADRFGRRLTLYSVICWTYIGVMLEVIAKDWQTWLGSKIVIGFGTGIMQMAVTTTVSEMAPRELRGISLSFFNMAMNIGGLAATLIPWGTNKHYGSDPTDDRAFRVPLYVALACPTISLVLELWLLPESPWWLMMKGHKDKARKALDYLYGCQPNYDSDRAVAELEYTIAKELEMKALQKQTSYLDCFRGVDRRRTFCAVFPALTQNASGQNLAGTYATYFFQLAGQSDPLISSVITTAVGLAVNFISFFVLESKRVGRWALLFGGLIVMTACMLAIGLIDVIGGGGDTYSDAAGKCLTVFVALFIAGSTIGPGVVGWAFAGEVGSPQLRAKTATLGTAGNAILGLVWTSVLPYILDADQANLGPKAGFIFFAFGVVCCILVFFFIPDLTGRSFAEIDELFARRIPARRFASTKTTGNYGADLSGEVVHKDASLDGDKAAHSV